MREVGMKNIIFDMDFKLVVDGLINAHLDDAI